jgi:hypothetical protein
VAVAAVAGVLWFIGLAPAALGGGAIALALAFTGLMTVIGEGGDP